MNALRVLRSPLLHFFALGGLIFVAFALLNDDPITADPDAISLNPTEAARLVDQFVATWNRPPTESELDGLMQAWAMEEAQVREALALGLDRGDAVIRQRLNLKMQFLAESGAAALVADEEVLQAHLDANSARFASPAQFAFDQILLPDDEGGLDDIQTALYEGADPAEMGRPSLLPVHLPLTSAPVIDRMYGSGFAEALAAQPGTDWQGPVQSGYGLHLVRVTDRREAAMPPLSAIRDQVEQDWRAAKAREMREAFGQALLDRYELNLPSAAEVLAR